MTRMDSLELKVELEPAEECRTATRATRLGSAS
jgi:hypothetical protein